MNDKMLGWLGILRLGLVQTALGSIVVLTTSTINRVMVVELSLPAMLPGALVGLHYAVQIMRPRFGHGSDLGGRRTPWILGGMTMLAMGGALAALATAWMSSNAMAGLALAIVAFVLVGLGVAASGTTLLALMAIRVDQRRRAAAATLVWLMMIAGFIITAGLAGHFLDPFSFQRLVVVTSVVCVGAVLLTAMAIHGIEGPRSHLPAAPPTIPESGEGNFRQALAQVWAEPTARRFTIFVFISMLAYSAQDLILEPFAGIVFGMTPGQSTQLSGVQSSGLLLGMIMVALLGTTQAGRQIASLRVWTITGCMASAAALVGLAMAGLKGPPWPLNTSVFALGFANGVFAVAAIGSMMGLADKGRSSRAGTRMGLWGAAQAFAFALGGFLGTAMVDLNGLISSSPRFGYAAVFILQAILFVAAACLALRVEETDPDATQPHFAKNTAHPE
jgi:MFS transporter, BCD family, chlorophyll transporter